MDWTSAYWGLPFPDVFGHLGMTSPNPNHRLWGLVMAGVTRIYRSVHGGGRPQGIFENYQTLVLRNRLVNNKTRTSGVFFGVHRRPTSKHVGVYAATIGVFTNLGV